MSKGLARPACDQPISPHCRLCGSEALHSVLDWGACPPCEVFLTAQELEESEVTYPLHVRLCEDCLMLQIPAQRMNARDGIPATAANAPTASGAAETGHVVHKEYGPADLVVAGDVWTNIPDVLGFSKGLRVLLPEEGLVSIDVQHALDLVRNVRFETICPERVQYWTVLAAEAALARGGLRLVDVEPVSAPEGSIRLWAAVEEADVPVSRRVDEVRQAEIGAKLDHPAGYLDWAAAASRIRDALPELLIMARRDGLTVVGYGAPGTGNAMLNYCGIRADLVSWIADPDPGNHGRFTPGTRIPIVAPEWIPEARPDLVLVLPGDRRDDIVEQLAGIAAWGGRLVFAQPAVHIVDPARRAAVA